jgi:hypothetical protein
LAISALLKIIFNFFKIFRIDAEFISVANPAIRSIFYCFTKLSSKKDASSKNNKRILAAIGARVFRRETVTFIFENSVCYQ